MINYKILCSNDRELSSTLVAFIKKRREGFVCCVCTGAFLFGIITM